MGARNPDRIHFAAYADVSPTIGKMLAARWNVRAKCDTCGLTMKVRLGDMVKLRGPEFRLWGKKTFCRDLACVQGQMTFWASPPGSGQWNQLRAEWDPAERERRRQLNAKSPADPS